MRNLVICRWLEVASALFLTRECSDLEKHLWTPCVDGSKHQTAAEQRDDSLELILRTRQIQKSEPQHGLTDNTNNNNNMVILQPLTYILLNSSFTWMLVHLLCTIPTTLRLISFLIYLLIIVLKMLTKYFVLGPLISHQHQGCVTF